MFASWNDLDYKSSNDHNVVVLTSGQKNNIKDSLTKKKKFLLEIFRKARICQLWDSRHQVFTCTGPKYWMHRVFIIVSNISFIPKIMQPKIILMSVILCPPQKI